MFEFHAIPYRAKAKSEFYHELRGELRAMYLASWFTNLANASSSIMAHLPRLNWVGFYLEHNGELVLGPFQGLPACLSIPLGKGVCGTAAQQGKSLVVGDVSRFSGHIVCDARSQSEIVIPLRLDKRRLGVLDLDSPDLNRFDTQDQAGLEALVEDLVSLTPWPATFLSTKVTSSEQ